MSRDDHNAPASGPVVRFLLATWLTLFALSCAPAYGLDSGDIRVVSVKGDVRVERDGAAQPLRAGVVLELPATVRTGHDGAVDLRQGKTTVSVAPDTVLEFPALEKRGAPIDRVVQPRGNAFYDVGKRDGRKLRVETPYLVAVIKGTQFNVAAQDDATTISLFEGLLEIHAADDSMIVDLHAGEIAARHRGDKGISILEMDAKAPAPRAPQGRTPASEPGGGASNPDAAPDAPRARPDLGDSLFAGRDRVVDVLDGAGLNGRTAGAVSATDANVSVTAGGVEANVNADVGASPSADAGAAVTTGVDAGPVPVNVGTSVGVDVAPTGAAVDVGTSVGVDVTPTGAAVDVGTSVGVDVTPAGAAVDVGTNVGVDVTPTGAAVDVGTSVGVDLTPTGAAADAATSAAVDVGNEGVGADIAVDVGATTPLADAGVAADVNLGAGNVDLGVTAGDVALDLTADLGLGNDDDDDNSNSGPGSDNAGPGNSNDTTTEGGNIVDDAGGLLDGLLRRHRGK